MKSNLVRICSIFFLLQLAYGAIRWKCPKSVGLFEHPTDCSKYINCYKSHATVQQCPNCYVFNETTGYCDFPENVDCSGKRIAQPVLAPECPGCFGLFQDPSNCSVFYNCIGGKGLMQVCPNELYFNEETQACDFGTAVSCPSAEDQGILLLEDGLETDYEYDYFEDGEYIDDAET